MPRPGLRLWSTQYFNGPVKRAQTQLQKQRSKSITFYLAMRKASFYILALLPTSPPPTPETTLHTSIPQSEHTYRFELFRQTNSPYRRIIPSTYVRKYSHARKHMQPTTDTITMVVATIANAPALPSIYLTTPCLAEQAYRKTVKIIKSLQEKGNSASEIPKSDPRSIK